MGMNPEEITQVRAWADETFKDYKRGRTLGGVVCGYTDLLPTHSIRSQMLALCNEADEAARLRIEIETLMNEHSRDLDGTTSGIWRARLAEILNPSESAG